MARSSTITDQDLGISKKEIKKRRQLEIELLWQKCKASVLSFEIPGHPPSVNELYATIRGLRVKTRVGRDWETYSSTYTHKASVMAYGTSDLSLLKGRPLSLEFIFYRPSWRAKSGSGLYVRPDVSNFIKAGEDAIMKALGLDDCAVISLNAMKLESAPEHGGVRTSVRIVFLGEQADG